MKDIELLNELDAKIREMAASLERERHKSLVSSRTILESEKLSRIEEKLKSIISTINNSEIARNGR